MKIRIGIPSIPLTEQTPTVRLLLNIVEQQQVAINLLVEEVEVLKEEVKRLKKHKGKPRIKPSQMDKDKPAEQDPVNPKKRADSKGFITCPAWEGHLDLLGIKMPRHRQIATEGALVGSILSNGRRCRDTFASLKKTCRKLKVNFWDYLLDRHSKIFKIPKMPNLISLAAGVA